VITENIDPPKFTAVSCSESGVPRNKRDVSYIKPGQRKVASKCYF